MRPNRRQVLSALAGGTTVVAAWAWGKSSAAAERTAYTRFPSEAEIRERSPEHWKLVDLINAYRRRIRLPSISLSPKLTIVAYLHVRDLAEKQPHKTYGSLHSWSQGQRWTGGAFRLGDEKTYPVMWEKPKEITGYQGNGFEISAASVRDMPHALQVWQRSALHNDVILNRRIWRDLHWRAIGAAFYKGFACAWFGEEVDA